MSRIPIQRIHPDTPIGAGTVIAAPVPRTCRRCPRVLHKTNASGLCHKHLWAKPGKRTLSPERRAQIAEQGRRALASPGVREAGGEVMRLRWIERERALLADLDDEAALVFAAARDAGESLAQARALGLMDMEERGLTPPTLGARPCASASASA